MAIISKGNFVLVPRQEYEELLCRQPKLIPLVKLTPAEMRAVERSEKELARGDYVTLGELEHELRSANIKKR